MLSAQRGDPSPIVGFDSKTLAVALALRKVGSGISSIVFMTPFSRTVPFVTRGIQGREDWAPKPGHASYFGRMNQEPEGSRESATPPNVRTQFR